MKKILYIFLVSILIFSCTKGGGNIYIEGRVFNPVTGDGIKGIEIDLLRNKFGGAVGAQSGGVKLCELVYTDENGHFEIKHTGGLQSYYVQALPNAEDYYGIGWINISTKNKTYPIGGGSFTVKKGKNMHADFRAVPYGYIKLNINNINCQGAGDHFVLYSEGTQVDINKNGLMIDETGCYQYNEVGYSKIPMGGRYYRWEVTRNGITTTFRDTAYFAEDEYKTYTIDY